MYLRILKKDLKRKRAMNVILLVFIILASMFMSSGVSNIITVTTALDSYFEMADVPDYWTMSENKSSDKDICRTLEKASAIDEFRIEEFVRMSQSNIMRVGEPLNDSSVNQIFVLQSDSDMGMNYFLDDESILKSVPKGEIYATRFIEKSMGLAYLIIAFLVGNILDRRIVQLDNIAVKVRVDKGGCRSRYPVWMRYRDKCISCGKAA